MKFLHFLPILFFAHITFGQTLLSSNSAAYQKSMGGAAVTVTDIQSIFSNQAGLTTLKDWAITLNAGQQFGLSELKEISLAGALATKSGTLGLSIYQFGFEAYREQKLGFAYARKLMKQLAVGVQFDYLNIRIPEYGSRGLLTFEIGIQATLSKEILLAAHLFSPTQITVLEGESLPTIFKIGAAYRPAEKVLLALEVEKDQTYAARFKAGLQYELNKKLVLRTGIATKPTLISFGMGINLKTKWQIDSAASFHPVLGFSPAAGVRFEKNRK